MKTLHCPTCSRPMRPTAKLCFDCGGLAYQVGKAAQHESMIERRRARYADELKTLEWYVQELTLTEDDYHAYFRFVPRHVLEERRQQTLGRLNFIRERCELAPLT